MPQRVKQLEDIGVYVRRWAQSPFGGLRLSPWEFTQNAPRIIGEAINQLGDDYRRVDGGAVHLTAEVETGATLKGAVIIGPRCFISSSALLRGGVFLDKDCIVGPAVELKTTFMFAASKVAHLSFVGDSILGSDVNVEAGAIIANYRNELADRAIRIAFDGQVIETGVDKFGALVGDGSRIGANAVIAPGAVLAVESRVGRLTLVDQYPR
jgi:bifunctional UDP-N-acetylglucosamine pyrophosphorylase / glucosamine-1-phosphate N-acetyltransferase